MINFRYHVVSIIAVFLALGIGIIMGTAVIDRAVVDRLERQQKTLSQDVEDVQAENNRLRRELRDEREAARQLADEGSERLLDGALADVPVLVVAPEGADVEGVEDFDTLLGRAGARSLGTLRLSDRFTLDDDGELDDLTAALGFREGASAGTLRSAALSRLARTLRPALSAVPPDTLVPALQEAGFLEFDPPEGADEAFPVLPPTTRIVVLSGPGTAVPDNQLSVPFVRALLASRPDRGPVAVLGAGDTPEEGAEEPTFVGLLRDDDQVNERMSTVDDLDAFAGRVAAVLALGDLGSGRFGHYGRGPGAQRLLPAPVE